MAVAGQREVGSQASLVELLLDVELEGGGCQKARRREPVQRRGGRHEHYIGGFIASFAVLAVLIQAPQGGQPLADQILVRRKRVVRQGLPVGEQRAAQLGREENDFLQQALGVSGVGRDNGHQPAGRFLALAELRQQQGVGRTHRAWQRVALVDL